MHRTTLVVTTLMLASTLAAADKEKLPDEPKDAFGTMAAPRQPPATPPPRVVVAPEIGKLAKLLVGTYKCKGVSLKGDGSSTPLEANVAIKLDLDNAWIVESLAETKGGVKFEDYRTFDATAKQWTKIQLASTSAHVIATSLGERDGKWTWEGNAIAPSGTTQVRDYEQITAKQIKVWGEAMLGGTWQKTYEATCKR